MDTDTVTIKEAIAFVRNYVALLQLRFENIEMELPEFEYDDSESILPFSLQILIENAVKHNAPNSHEKLIIRINREGDYIVVSNNILHRQDEADNDCGLGVGLANLRARHKTKLHRNIIVKNGSDSFKVYIPIIKAEK